MKITIATGFLTLCFAPLLWLLTYELTATIGSALILWGMIAIVAREDNR
jgi:hypothetical protein